MNRPPLWCRRCGLSRIRGLEWPQKREIHSQFPFDPGKSSSTTENAVPSWFQSTVLTTRQFASPGFAGVSNVACVSLMPSKYQTASVPPVCWNTRSRLPSLLKSPTATTLQFRSPGSFGFKNDADLRLASSMNQTASVPSVCWKMRSTFLSPLKQRFQRFDSFCRRHFVV